MQNIQPHPLATLPVFLSFCSVHHTTSWTLAPVSRVKFVSRVACFVNPCFITQVYSTLLSCFNVIAMHFTTP